ncbi:MAG: polyphosphate kinase 1 [Planctomycetota bacterium]
MSSEPIDLEDPSLYINRELSLLEFNRRVLEQARDVNTPLLERLRFLTIASANLDEFFEIRVAGLRQQVAFGVSPRGADGLSPLEQLQRIGVEAKGMVAEQYRVLNDELLPALAEEGVRILRRQAWTDNQADWVKRVFRNEVLPVLTPIGIDPSHPFPRVLNKGLSFLVTLSGNDAYGREGGVAVLQVPRSLPRVYRMMPELSKAEYAFVMVSSIIHHHVGELFPGMEVTGCYQFRVTRNSDLWVDEEEVENLLKALQGELPSRKYGEAVRLEVADTCTEEMAQFLLQNVGLREEDLYRVNGPVNLNRLDAIHGEVDRADLKYPIYVPGTPPASDTEDLFARLRAGDLLLHHPYQNFQTVIDLLVQAARDPQVLAIRQTVYRTDLDSGLVDALVEAARAGKEVTAVVELRARFDEAQNIDLAQLLESAGAQVAYGVVGYKAHAKMLLIVRREGRRMRRYVHLGTGNYHAGTARAYTDIGLLTCDTDISTDVQRLFQQLTGLGRASRLKRLLQAPFTLSKRLHEHIERLIGRAKSGQPARLRARMNSLAEPEIVRALYRASQAGVQIDLIVRGICCLRPGIPGVSENIRVRSIIGRFLEHTRCYQFQDDEEDVVYLSSADWMPRNFFRRVETAFPILDDELRARVVEETLDWYLEDNSQAWTLASDGTYKRLRPGSRKPRVAQERLMEKLGARVEAEDARSVARATEESLQAVPRTARRAPEELS